MFEPFERALEPDPEDDNDDRNWPLPGSGRMLVDPTHDPHVFDLRLAERVVQTKRIRGFRHPLKGTKHELFERSLSSRDSMSSMCEASKSICEVESDLSRPRDDNSFNRLSKTTHRSLRYTVSMPLENINPMLQVQNYLSFAAFLAPFAIAHLPLPENLNESILGEGLTFKVSEAMLRTEYLYLDWPPDILASKTLVALKRVKAPSFLNGSAERKAIQDVCLELRVLLHPPLKRHKNIIDILCIGWESIAGPMGCKASLPLLIVEHATHGNLQDYQNGQSLSWEKKRLFCLDIALALQVLHECGIVHGDVKSENVLLFSHDEREVIAKLSDFGCSLLENDYEGGRVVLGGTPMWAAPEVTYGPVPVQLATLTDVYSFGLLTWRLCIDGHNPLTSSMIFDIEVEPDQYSDQLLRQIQNCKEQQNFMDVCTEHGHFLAQDSLPLTQLMEDTLHCEPTSRKDMRAIVPLLSGNKKSENPAAVWWEQQPVTQCPSLFSTDYTGESPKDILNCMFLDDQYTQTQQKLPREVTSEIISSLLNIATPCQTQRCAHCMTATIIDKTPSIVSFDRLVEMREELHCTAMGGDMALVRAAEAAFELSFCFTVGYGVEASEDQASKWIVFAASNGLRRAQAIVKPLFDSFRRPVPEDLPYLTWLYNGMVAGSVEASRELARISPVFHRVATENLLRCYRGIGRYFWKDHNPAGTWPIDDIEQLKEMIQDIGVPIDDIQANGHYGDRLLHLAAANDCPKTIEFLVTFFKADLNTTNLAGETPLFAACRSGRTQTAKMLLGKGADVTASTEQGVTALHWLFSFELAEEAMEIASTMCSTGIDLNQSSSPQKFTYESPTPLSYCGSPLHWAITSRRAEATKILLNLGADPNLSNSLHKTPLELAVALHFREGIELLLPSLKEPLAVSLLRIGIRQMSPFFHRIQFGSSWMEETSKTLQMIIAALSKTTFSRQLTEAIPQLFEDAIQRWPISLVDILIDTFSSLSLGLEPMSSLEKPLALLIEQDKSFCFDSILSIFTEHFHFDINNPSLIYVAATTNNPHYILQLLERGADPFVLTKDGFDSFGVAVLTSNLPTAQAILNHSSSNTQNRHFEASGPSILGAEHGPATLLGRLLSMPQIEESSISYLLQLPPMAADFVVCPKSQATALHVISGTLESYQRPTAVKRYRRVLSTVIQYYNEDYQLNALDSYCKAPLHWAVEAVNFEAVSAFLVAGADPNKRGNGQGAALDIAYAILSEEMLGKSSSSVHSGSRNSVKMGKEGKKLFQARLDEIIDLLRDYDATTAKEAEDGVLLNTTWNEAEFDEDVLNRDDIGGTHKRTRSEC